MRLPVFLSALLMPALPAALIVSEPEPITHQVFVQPIVVSNDNGSNTAVFMGDAAAEAYIKGEINRIWAQVGIEIVWEEEVSYSDTFTNSGSGNYASSSRPSNDLYAIVRDDDEAPKSASATTINMFFVNICPAFPQLSSTQVAGYARVDRNGTTVTVGSQLPLQLNWTGGINAGRDSIASVLAHEIGHCMGLSHISGMPDNLMYSGSGTAPEYLIQSQADIVFTDDSGIDGFDFAISTTPEPTQYELWALAEGISGDAEADDDQDRFTNGFEFLFGFDPNSHSSLPAPIQTPQGLVWSLDPPNQNALDDGFSWFAESSTDLSNWVEAGTPGSGSQRVYDFSNPEKVQFRLDPDQPGVFLRFGVDVPAAAASVQTVEMAEEHAHGEQCSGNCCVKSATLAED